ncbi:MAG: SIMPL domain-containing protein [Victivallaceae bacterium]|nr:SIMPL domain-containing protein [Victivallaceae bacterium]
MKKITVVAAVSIILAVAIVGGAFCLSRFMLKIEKTTEKNITVKGVATREITSDIASFTCRISCNHLDIAGGYQELERITAIFNKKLAELGVTSNEVEDISISCDRMEKSITATENNRTTTRSVFSHYRFNRSCRIVTRDVQKAALAVVQLYALSGQKIDIFVSNPVYMISDPEQYKLELVDRASQAAYKRAQVVAETAGSKLGKLRVARQGVIQITRVGSNDSSDYGTYDTESIKKEMRMVVTLDFALE